MLPAPEDNQLNLEKGKYRIREWDTLETVYLIILVNWCHFRVSTFKRRDAELNHHDCLSDWFSCTYSRNVTCLRRNGRNSRNTPLIYNPFTVWFFVLVIIFHNLWSVRAYEYTHTQTQRYIRTQKIRTYTNRDNRG